jgi:hypothetical protein
MAGRPPAELDEDKLRELVELGFSETVIATRLGVSTKYVFVCLCLSVRVNFWNYVCVRAHTIVRCACVCACV